MSGIGRVASGVVVGCVLVLGGTGVGFGQILINEVMYDPSVSGDVNAEWFELYNSGTDRVDVHGWKIKDDTSTSETHTISTTEGLLWIASKGFLVLGRNSDKSQNGGVTVDYVYSTVSLSNSADGLILTNGTDVEQDTVIWGSANSFPDPSNSASIALKGAAGTPGVDPSGNTLDNSMGSNWCISTKPIKGGVDAGTPGGENSDCLITLAYTGEIWGIQGSGAVSPHVRAESVTTNDNVVTAVGAGGFFMQTPASSSDNDPDTSDGIFVVHSGSPTVIVGDQVDVIGTVEEFFGFTRFASGATVMMDASNQPLPAFVEFNESRPAKSPASANCAMEPECYEGMLIRIESGTVLSGSQYFGSDNIAEMYIRPGSGRAFRDPGVRYPGISGRPGIPVWDGNPEVFELDPDKLGQPNVSWLPGATFSAAGVLGYEFRGYELWATEHRLRSGGIVLPQPVRSKAGGEVTVASLNVLNLREGDSDLKYQKLSLYIREVLGSPDVIGFQEVYLQAALAKLATRISTDDSNVVYTAHVVETANSLAVGFLVRSGVTVEAGSPTEHGSGETFVDPRDNSNDNVHDRLPLMLKASVGDFAFTVINIHNRSLIDTDDPARGVWVRAKRLAQAQSVARLVQQQNDTGAKVIVVGDYNAYQFTDGYVDVVGQIKGSLRPSRNLLSGPDLVQPNLCNLVDGLPAAEQYSLLFEGTAQALDHALVNRPMSRHVVEMQYGRGNLDAAGVNRETANALASSDHDGFVVFLSTTDRGRSVCPVGQEDGPDGGGGGLPPPSGTADLDIDAESQVVSASKVRYSVNVENAGPDTATNVVVTSSFSGAAVSVAATTSGCDEDPDGLPECNLGDIAAGDSASFTIDVDTGGASETSLRYSGAAGSDTLDPTPRDDGVNVSQPLGPPNAPTDLAATAISSTEIELRWQDHSRVETGFDVFLQGPGDSKLRLIGSVPANTTSTVVDELVPSIKYNFAVEARNGPLRSERTPKSTATTWFSDAARCGEDDVLCLGGFEVEVEWDDGKGRLGRGMAEQLTADAGDFWFFHPANIELVVKVLDGCEMNGHYWVFAAGLTDVEVTTTVRDLRTGAEKVWMNPQGTVFEPIGDTSAFATCGEASSTNGASRIRLSGAPKGRAAELYLASLTQADRVVATSSACTASETALCLQSSRYEVRANWQTGERSGAATVIPRTADTGMFWFFSQGNVELIVKVLDGCALNGHRWVLMGGLTDVGVEIMVTDSESGEAKMYGNPEGSPFATMFDVTAFSCSAGQ